jgi:perosamine synthetase
MMDWIPVAGPSISEKEIAYVLDAVEHAWYSDAYKPITQFEQAFAEYVGRDYAIALPSCTSGLHLALAALGVGPGDEVIVPDLTWIASAAPISYVGATAVFADVDPSDLCMSARTLAPCITPRTKAAIVVDLYGAIPDMAEIESFADDAGIAIIEDAAEAVGSERDGRRAGGFGRASVFSFHGSKTMTTGEGGMLVADDPGMIDRINRLRDHGRSPRDRAFDNTEVAFKYKMSALQAALGRAQLERLEELLDRKRRIHGWYAERLEARPDISVISSAHRGVTWWMVSVQVDPATGWDKDRLQSRLAEVGIDSRPAFRPLSSLPAYAEHEQAVAARNRNEVAYRLSPYCLNLPTALSLTELDVERVCSELVRIVDDRAS